MHEENKKTGKRSEDKEGGGHGEREEVGCVSVSGPWLAEGMK